MKEGFLTVDIGSIANTKKIIDEKYSELVSMVNKYKDTIENSKNIYDTESASLYRKIAINYIEIVEKYLNNEFKPYVDRLDEIKSIYTDEYNAIRKSIQGGIK